MILFSKINQNSRSIPMFFYRSYAAVNRTVAFKILNLKKFDDEEISDSYNRLKNEEFNDRIDILPGIKKIVLDNKKLLVDEKQINEIALLLSKKNETNNFDAKGSLTLNEYKFVVKSLAEKLDSRIWNISLSFLFTGMSVGIIIPCMPLLVQQLNIPASQFGFIISAFALSKLIGNIPTGYLVEKYGRKPMIVGGLGLTAFGIGSIGLALLPGLGTPWLIGCRFLNGIGVSAITAGGFMYISDISTTLNRTRTLAPVSACFSGGMALGPAVGGFLIESFGITNTYAIVGGMLGMQAIANSFLLTETLETKISIKTSANITQENSNSIDTIKSSFNMIQNIFKTSLLEWKILLKNKEIKHLVGLNGAFWFSLSGSQMTLLPLYMINPVFHFGAYEIGGCFAFMSVVSVLASQPLAYFADKVGKITSIVSGCSLFATSIFCLPLASSLPHLIGLLFPFALGSTAMQSTPTSLMSDLSSNKHRSQALSLLRTVGDLGLFSGAICSGLLAHHTSIECALVMNASIMATSTACFLMLKRKNNKSKIE